MAKLQVFTYENLLQYDPLIKGEIDKRVSAAAAKSIKTVSISGNTLNFYTVSEPVGTTSPVYSITLPSTDISGLMEKLSGATAGNLVKVAADGVNVEDTGIAAADIAMKSEVETAKATLQSAIDSANGKLTTLIGEDAGKSARTIANEELAKQLIADNAKESLDTLEEIAAWIQSHPDDASAMSKAIEDLENLVGTLPAGITSTNVVDYIGEVKAALVAAIATAKDEAIATAAADATTKADKALSDAKTYTDAEVAKDRARIDAAEADIDGLQDSLKEGGATYKLIEEAKKAGTEAKSAAAAAQAKADQNAEDITGLRADVDAVKADYLKAADKTELQSDIAKNTSAISALEAKVGDGFEAIPTEKITALFAE